MILAKVRGARRCEGITSVTVYEHERDREGANWDVQHLNPGTAGREACLAELGPIVRSLRTMYDVTPTLES